MANLDKSFYRKCEECNRLRLLGTQCKQMTGDTCDNDSRYFYDENEIIICKHFKGPILKIKKTNL